MITTFKPEDCRPFNYEHAKAGAPVCQRNGEAVDIFKWDVRSLQPIHGIVKGNEDLNDRARSWCMDGSWSGDIRGSNSLIMKPLGYVEGRPVHVGDEIVSKSSGVHVKAFAQMNALIGDNYTWPELDDHSKEHQNNTEADRDDFLSMFSESTIREVAYKIRGKAAASIAVEVVLSVIGETAEHRIIQAVDTLKIKGVTPPPAVPAVDDTVTLTKSDMAHVVWAYFQLAGSRFGLDSTVAHMTALREIAVKHGGLVEAKGKAPEPAPINLSQIGDVSPAVPVRGFQRGMSFFLDDILPGNFPVKFGEALARNEEAIKETLTVPPELLKPDDDPAETAFWNFDAMKKGYAQWKGRPLSERDAFKLQYRAALNTAEGLRQKFEGQAALNSVQADHIRKLTEANTALENLNRSYLEDNAKMDKMLDEQMAETGRWMAEAKKLVDETKALNSKVSAELPVNYIEWTGGECPVAATNVVKVMFRNGSTWHGMADGVNWSHTDSRVNWSDHIVGYKVAK